MRITRNKETNEIIVRHNDLIVRQTKLDSINHLDCSIDRGDYIEIVDEYKERSGEFHKMIIALTTYEPTDE